MFPDICLDDNQKCPGEWPVLKFAQGACSEQTVQLRDEHGAPIALDNRVVWFLAKETMNTSTLYLALITETVDAAQGIVKIRLTEQESRRAGMFVAEFDVYDAVTGSTSSSSSAPDRTCVVLHKVRCYLELQQSLDDPMATQYHTLSVAEIRLAMRDKCREDNFLLDNVEFSNAEISWAINRPIEYWNEIPPPIGRYDATNFPFRYHWVLGVIGELLAIAALHYDRNTLGYQAGGIAVDDRAKGQVYAKASDQYRQEYRAFVAQKKREINMGLAYGRIEIASFGNNKYPYT